MRVFNDWLPLEHLPDLTFIFWLASVIKFEFVSASSHPKDFEAVNFGNEAWSGHHLVIVVLKYQNAVSTESKSGSLTLRNT